MLGWFMLGIAGMVIILLAGILSRILGRSHFGADRSTGHYITEAETTYRRPH